MKQFSFNTTFRTTSIALPELDKLAVSELVLSQFMHGCMNIQTSDACTESCAVAGPGLYGVYGRQHCLLELAFRLKGDVGPASPRYIRESRKCGVPQGLLN